MVFIVQGKLESIGEDNNVVPLSQGEVCGEELVTLCLEHSVLNRNGYKYRIPAHKLLSKRMLLIRNPHVQGTIKKPVIECLGARGKLLMDEVKLSAMQIERGEEV
ncbi:hypothetical protein POM88_047156 [Heracleum sosnowskyi]|uniref:Uncharacterized protein n=1 Tax=Heracleum sosnowskyi TaxID=360622 RepID=A0AAD8HAN9_9APIA|nr:hypothetical protein POM88_047156 [Heracleum sosnowskyi]